LRGVTLTVTPPAWSVCGASARPAPLDTVAGAWASALDAVAHPAASSTDATRAATIDVGIADFIVLPSR
jgi:hypothetical protein